MKHGKHGRCKATCTILLTLNFRSFFLHSAGKVDEKATQLHAIASLKVLLDATKPQANAGPDGSANGSAQTGTGGGGGAPGSALADGDAHDSGRASQGTEVSSLPRCFWLSFGFLVTTLRNQYL